MDVIEQSLSTHETISPSPRFADRVMAEVRATAEWSATGNGQQATATAGLAWRWLALKSATYLSLAAAAVVVATSVDPAAFAPVAIYLMATSAGTVALLGMMRLRQLS